MRLWKKNLKHKIMAYNGIIIEGQFFGDKGRTMESIKGFIELKVKVN